MNRNDYKKKLGDWEAEGYDVSELREKWFPSRRGRGRSHLGTWLAIVTAVFIVVAGVIIWQVIQPYSLAPAPAEKSSAIPEQITITGKVVLEDENNYDGVQIALWKGGSGGYIATTPIDANGNYGFTEIPIPLVNDRETNYTVHAYNVGFADSSINILRDPQGLYTYAEYGTKLHLVYDNATVRIPDIVLFKPKKITFRWVYQPNGTPNFSGNDLTSGTASLVSSWTTYLGKLVPSERITPQPIRQSSGGAFFFSRQTTNIPFHLADFYFSHSSNYPLTFWANNGSGGIHDMGDVPLESINNAPDKSNGVGPFMYYNEQATDAIVGHTYCVVTNDGTHYAKFRVTDISLAKVE